MLLQRKRALTVAAFVMYPAIAFLLLKCAPFPGKGLIEFIDFINREMTEKPFSLSWSDNSIRVLLIGTVAYALIWFIAITSVENTRPGEEYGSARWTSPASITRKFRARYPFRLKDKARMVCIPWKNRAKDELKEAIYLECEQFLLVNNFKMVKQPKAPRVKKKKAVVHQNVQTSAMQDMQFTQGMGGGR